MMGNQDFFYAHAVAVEQPPDGAGRHRKTVPLFQMGHDLRERDLRRLIHQTYDLSGMRLYPVGTCITASRPQLKARASD
jgi:hypothetical protein